MRVQSALLLGVAVLVAGCSNQAAQLVGKWQMDSSSSATDSSVGASFAKEMAKAMTVEFKADKTFNMTMIFPISGTWSMNGNDVTLHMTSILGMDPSKMKDSSKSAETQNQDMHATLSADGKTLTMISQKDGKSTPFVRATS